MPRQHEIGPDARLLAARIDRLQHRGTGKMIARPGKRRMMHRENQCLRILVRGVGLACRQGCGQLLLQKSDLVVADHPAAQHSHALARI